MQITSADDEFKKIASWAKKQQKVPFKDWKDEDKKKFISFLKESGYIKKEKPVAKKKTTVKK